jgi:hypothetical protein
MVQKRLRVVQAGKVEDVVKVWRFVEVAGGYGMVGGRFGEICRIVGSFEED